MRRSPVRTTPRSAPTSRRTTSSTAPVATWASISSAPTSPPCAPLSAICDSSASRSSDGNFLAARTTFSGDFTGVFTYSPIGPVEPTGQHLEWEVIGTFRYHDDGRLAEEWVQTDYRSFLIKLGVTTREPAERSRL